MTSLPLVNKSIVQLGFTRRRVTAANFLLLNDEKRKICLSLSSCSGADICIWAVATMLWMKGWFIVAVSELRINSKRHNNKKSSDKSLRVYF